MPRNKYLYCASDVRFHMTEGFNALVEKLPALNGAVLAEGSDAKRRDVVKEFVRICNAAEEVFFDIGCLAVAPDYEPEASGRDIRYVLRVKLYTLTDPRKALGTIDSVRREGDSFIIGLTSGITVCVDPKKLAQHMEDNQNDSWT